MKHIYLLILVLASLQIAAQQQFQKSYSLLNTTEGNVSRALPNGRYVIAGESRPIGTSAGLLTTTDPFGNVNWMKEYAGGYDVRFEDVQPLSDGGFIIAGIVDTSASGLGFDGLLVRTDSLGQITWAYAYGGNDEERFASVAATADGGFVACGYTASYSFGDDNIFVVKVGSTGLVSWATTIGTFGTDRGFEIIPTPNGYAIAGGTDVNGSMDAYVIQLDPNGLMSWSTYAGGFSFDVARSIVQDGNNLILGGSSDSYTSPPNNFRNVMLFELAPGGSLVWNGFYDLPGEFSDAFRLVKSSNGDLALAGYTSGEVRGTLYNGFLLETNNTGDLLWGRVYGEDSKMEQIFAVSTTNDNGFILTGYTDPTVTRETYIIKTDSLGQSNCRDSLGGFMEIDSLLPVGPVMDTAFSITPPLYNPGLITTTVSPTVTTYCLTTGGIEAKPKPQFSLFPNPAHDQVLITLNENKESVLEVTDIMGRIVESSAFNNQITFSVQDWTPGVYLVRIISDGGASSVYKLVVE